MPLGRKEHMNTDIIPQVTWLSIKEYCEKYRISRSCVRRMIERKQLQARKFGETWRILDKEEI